ncbi:MAG: ArsR/SmtB family transcription factor [Lysobacter sp.]
MTTHNPPKHDISDACTTAAHAARTVPTQLSSNDISILAETFRLLGDPSRLKILLQCIRGPVSVGDLAEGVDLSQSLVSHHLRLLRAARLVRGERHGKHIFYEIADHHVSQILHDMAVHIAEDHPED